MRFHKHRLLRSSLHGSFCYRAVISNHRLYTDAKGTPRGRFHAPYKSYNVKSVKVVLQAFRISVSKGNCKINLTNYIAVVH